MEHIASYQRKPFLKDHPPIMQTVMLVATATEQKLLAGTVLGIKDDKHAPLSTGFEANAILAEAVCQWLDDKNKVRGRE